MIVRGKIPRWVPRAQFMAALAPMEGLAKRHGGVLTVDCDRSSVHVTCETPDGRVCVHCGHPLHDRIARTSHAAGPRRAERFVLISFCDSCAEGAS